MRPRLPSERTIADVESILLRNVAPFVGLAGIVALWATNSSNPLAYGAAGTLVTLRKLSQLRDGPSSTDPPPTDGSPPPGPSS